jgi:5-methylcytosine-specific restriction endonuclease McrA
MSPLALLCVRHGLQPGSRCERCYAESEQRRRPRPAHKAHHTARHARLRRQVFARDGHVCVDCGSGEDLTLDYLVPLDAGGEQVEWNAETRCRSCNARAGRRSGRSARA